MEQLVFEGVSMADARPSILRLESSHSVWLFDTERMRYLRAPRGADEASPLSGTWEPYFDLEIDAETGSFTIALNERRTRFLRSRVDTPGAREVSEPTAEVPSVSTAD